MICTASGSWQWACVGPAATWPPGVRPSPPTTVSLITGSMATAGHANEQLPRAGAVLIAGLMCALHI